MTPLVEAGALLADGAVQRRQHRREPADALRDMGGDLIAAAAAAGHRPAGALEATTTGLHRLEGLEFPFPVLDWNGIALKDLIHSRHHVGVETWPAFAAITAWGW